MHPLIGLARIATGASAITRMTLPGIIISAVAYGVWRHVIKPELNRYESVPSNGLPEKKAN
ncbi:MAG: hypothetical protein IJU65_00825 [Desulfovibrio sp.]|nr:hypothetical protein [Desulfovibrio sp.]